MVGQINEIQLQVKENLNKITSLKRVRNVSFYEQFQVYINKIYLKNCLKSDRSGKTSGSRVWSVKNEM